MLKLWLKAGACLLALGSAAQAQTYHDSAGTVPQAFVPLVGCSIGGNCSGPLGTSNPLPVSGFDSGVVRVSATPGSAAHGAGQSVGGLLAVPLARVNGGSGILTSVMAWSSWGSTQSYVVRVWQKQPINTTCTDGAAFAASATDDAYLVGAGPASLGFAAPATTAGDAKTYAALTNLTWDYKNADATTTQNLYVCLVTAGSDTPGASATLSLSLSGPQD